MDKWIVFSIWQLVELVGTDVDERWEVAVVSTANKHNTGPESACSLHNQISTTMTKGLSQLVVIYVF